VQGQTAERNRSTVAFFASPIFTSIFSRADFHARNSGSQKQQKKLYPKILTRSFFH
jgi:hypothetical protein